MEINNSVIGTRFKVNINAAPIDGYHLGDIDWEVIVFVEGAYNRCGNGSKVIKKEECVYVDEDNYIIPIDTATLGAGTYYVTLKALYPDNDFKDGIRVEKMTISTGVTINAK